MVRRFVPSLDNSVSSIDYLTRYPASDYPLTISDFATRYLFSCEALATTQETYAFAVFERAFKDFGLPKAIRTDNGVPFASPHALFGLSKLAVWWLRLGIEIERIKPGHPTLSDRMAAGTTVIAPKTGHRRNWLSAQLANVLPNKTARIERAK